MALKNTYARAPVANYISRITAALVKGGAVGISQGYDQGRIEELNFLLDIKGNRVAFKLPVNWRKVQQVIKNEGIGRGNDDDYAYRVSWAILCDWVEAQMAILASESVTMPQLFLPYAMTPDGRTLYDQVVDKGLLLPPRM